jgi:Ca-activated chloride channel homolog
LRGESEELRQEVTQLARQYGLVTPYTAYLILEDETRRGVPLSLQSLPQLQRDEPAQQVARQFYSSANRDRTGPTAVSSARYGLALKQADNAQALGAGAREAERTLSVAEPVAATSKRSLVTAPAGPLESAGRLVQYTQQSRFVHGHNFVRNGDQWVDTLVQSQTNAARVKIQFNSTEYFDLVSKHPRVTPWLALGQNVQFALEGTVYDISAKAP